MKKIIKIIIFLFACLTTYSQVRAADWYQIYGNIKSPSKNKVSLNGKIQVFINEVNHKTLNTNDSEYEIYIPYNEIYNKTFVEALFGKYVSETPQHFIPAQRIMEPLNNIEIDINLINVNNRVRSELENIPNWNNFNINLALESIEIINKIENDFLDISDSNILYLFYRTKIDFIYRAHKSDLQIPYAFFDINLFELSENKKIKNKYSLLITYGQALNLIKKYDKNVTLNKKIIDYIEDAFDYAIPSRDIRLDGREKNWVPFNEKSIAQCESKKYAECMYTLDAWFKIFENSRAIIREEQIKIISSALLRYRNAIRGYTKYFDFDLPNEYIDTIQKNSLYKNKWNLYKSHLEKYSEVFRNNADLAESKKILNQLSYANNILTEVNNG